MDDTMKMGGDEMSNMKCDKCGGMMKKDMHDSSMMKCEGCGAMKKMDSMPMKDGMMDSNM